MWVLSEKKGGRWVGGGKGMDRWRWVRGGRRIDRWRWRWRWMMIYPNYLHWWWGFHARRQGCGSGTPIWASLAGLCVTDDNLVFTNGQSLHPLAWFGCDSWGMGVRVRRTKIFRRSVNGLKVKLVCKIFYRCGWIILRSNTLIFSLTLFSWVAKHHH